MGLFGGNKKRVEDHSLDLLDAALAETTSGVVMLLRVNDLYPVYVSSNFERVFGVPSERLADDAETLFRFVPEVERAQFKRRLREWDHRAPLVADVNYEMPVTTEGWPRPRLLRSASA